MTNDSSSTLNNAGDRTGHEAYARRAVGEVHSHPALARLGPEHYLMTTTSSGAATIWNWIEMWLQTEHPDWQVHVTPVTTGLTSINIAGPNSTIDYIVNTPSCLIHAGCFI